MLTRVWEGHGVAVRLQDLGGLLGTKGMKPRDTEEGI